MSRTRRLSQMAFDFAPSVTPNAASTSEIADRIVREGLAPNTFILSMNRSVGAMDRSAMGRPWSLPSRLFTFPVRFLTDENGAERLQLRHPDLAGHPAIIALTRIVPEPEVWMAPQTEGNGTWMHAVDLMTPTLWPDLRETLHFTTHEQAAQALGNALMRRDKASDRNWSLEAARAVLHEISAEPDRESSRQLIAGPGLMPCLVEERWVPNVRCGGSTAAWLILHGLESGLLGYGPGGWISVTPDGIALRASGA